MSVFGVIQSKSGKILTKISSNTDTFHAVLVEFSLVGMFIAEFSLVDMFIVEFSLVGLYFLLILEPLSEAKILRTAFVGLCIRLIKRFSY